MNNIRGEDFDATVLDTCIALNQDNQEYSKEVELPASLSPKTYDLFDTSLNSYLDTKLGQGGMLLSYFLGNNSLHPGATVMLT